MNEKVTIQTVGPDRALKLLEVNPENRSIADGTVMRYAKIMLSQEWGLSPDAIAIDRNGTIINGQHRLWAVAVAEMPQRFVLLEGLDPEVRLFLDAHRPRSPSDTMKIHKPALNMRAPDIAVVRAFYSSLPSSAGLKFGAWPAALIERGAERILDALEFLRNHFVQDRRGFAAPVKTAVARAFFHVPTERLNRFCEVLFAGETTMENEFAALKLRKVLLEQGDRKIAPVALYQYTQAAIRAFVEHRNVTYLKASAEDIFPILGAQKIDVSQAVTPSGRAGRLNALQQSVLTGGVDKTKLAEFKKLVQLSEERNGA